MNIEYNLSYNRKSTPPTLPWQRKKTKMVAMIVIPTIYNSPPINHLVWYITGDICENNIVQILTFFGSFKIVKSDIGTCPYDTTQTVNNSLNEKSA